MRDSRLRTGTMKVWLRALGLVLAMAPGLLIAGAGGAVAAQSNGQAVAQRATASQPQAKRSSAGKQHQASMPNRGGKLRKAMVRRGGLQCVPFARNASGIIIQGNAYRWWEAAEGVYARGQAPEEGAILSFQAIRRMPLGHVAVVSKVINRREVEIDHANWAGPGGRKGMVKRGVSVVDVSDNNDWTAVRVELGQTGSYGSVYPTNGFIYERPDDGGTLVASATPGAGASPPAPAPRVVSLAPADTGGYASVTYVGGTFEEVAEAPAPVRRHVKRGRARTAAR